MYHSADSQRPYRGQSSGMDNPLFEPITKGRVEEVVVMIRRGEGRIQSDQLDEALLRAAGYGQAEVCEALISAGADPNTLEDRKEHSARLEGLSTFTGQQAKRHVWQDVHCSVGGSPLHRAAEGSHLATMSTLLRYGARVNQPDDNGVTPLMLTCMRRGRHALVSRLLLTPGCAINIKERRMGRTAMHFAAHIGDPIVLKILIEQGGDVDVRDYLQNTPLMLASTSSRYEDPSWPPADVSACIQLLVENGAFVNLVNRDSESALQRSLEIQNDDVVGLLLSHNALTHPGILRDACLIYKDVKVIERLLSMGGTLATSDDTLCAILILLVCDDSSQWMLNGKLDEKTTHEIARLLIMQVQNWKIVDEIVSKNEKEGQAIFGDEYYQAYHDNYKDDIVKFGLFGAALKHGKYGVAKMLYLAGSDLKQMRFLSDTSLSSHLIGNEWLRTWLPEALAISTENENCAADKATGESYESGNNSQIICSREIFQVEPYDTLIREQESGLLNQFYCKREQSQAANQQLLSLYQ